jgi:hypothetical protein
MTQLGYVTKDKVATPLLVHFAIPIKISFLYKYAKKHNLNIYRRTHHSSHAAKQLVGVAERCVESGPVQLVFPPSKNSGCIVRSNATLTCRMQ